MAGFASLRSRLRFDTVSLNLTTLGSLLLNALEALVALIIIALVGANYDAVDPDPDSGHGNAIYVFVVCVMAIFTAIGLAYATLSPPSTRIWVIALLGWQLVLVVLWATATGLVFTRYAPDGQVVSGVQAAAAMITLEFVLWIAGAAAGWFIFLCAGRWTNRKQQRGAY